jgi:hypothetical protein
MTRPLALLAAAVVVSSASASAPVPSFGFTKTVAQVSPDGTFAQIGVADVTGDGNPDIIGARVTNKGETHPLVVLAGNGKGAFRNVSREVFVGAPPRVVAARHILFADFNRDGRQDIFIADTGIDQPPYSGAPNELILSAPGGKLVDASGNLPPESGYTHSAAVGDVNHDRVPDLYIGNLCCGAPPEILLNDGGGHFSALSNALPPAMSDVGNGPRYSASTFADVNGDGWDDLVLAADDHAPRNEVLLNDHLGHFLPLPNALPAKPFGADAIGLAVAPIDLNGDGHVDLVIAGTRGTPFYVGRWLQLLVNTGHGTYKDETATRLPQSLAPQQTWPDALRVADLNGDRKPDLVVGLNTFEIGESPPVYLNRGDGTFSRLPLPDAPYAEVDVSDVNHDGRPDLASATATGPTDTYAVNFQLGPTTRPQTQTIRARVTRVELARHAFVIAGKTVFVSKRTRYRGIRGGLGGMKPGRRYEVVVTKSNSKYYAVSVTRL